MVSCLRLKVTPLGPHRVDQLGSDRDFGALRRYVRLVKRPR